MMSQPLLTREQPWVMADTYVRCCHFAMLNLHTRRVLTKTEPLHLSLILVPGVLVLMSGPEDCALRLQLSGRFHGRRLLGHLPPL